MAMPCNATEMVPARQNPPKDGWGPRGGGDCYYTSRVLDSTARYAKFVRKLRALEEDQEKGKANKLKELKDTQNSDFFIRCDRRSLINNVARRVGLCMSSYQEDLKVKKTKLITLLSQEEEFNVRKFVEQAQAGTTALWQDKKDRLAYLLAKRQKEHEEKYKDIPISKCVHVHPCIVRMRAGQTQKSQLYQMKENQSRKMAEKEIDTMWHKVMLKESEALAARMELDTIERLRRDRECVRYCNEQVRMQEVKRKEEQETLKMETLRMMAMYEKANAKEDEETRKREQKRIANGRERLEMIKERKETLARQAGAEKLIGDTWDSLAGMGLKEEEAKKALIKQKRMETEVCNKKMGKLILDKKARDAADDAAVGEEEQRLQAIIDQKRCELTKKTKKGRMECRDGLLEQIKDSAEERARHANDAADYDNYQSQLSKQLDQLVAHRELTEAQARKLHQKNLQQQIDYNKLLKERLKEEEIAQREKGKLAAIEYQQNINKIMSRAYFTDEVHPFAKPMHAGLKMQEKCPCSKPTYCAAPVLVVPKVSLGDKGGASPAK